MYAKLYAIKNNRYTEVGNMKNGGIDRRIIKTKNSIRTAFKQLVQQKEMSTISISELTKCANITRSTFYMYYNTVEDVREEIENDIINDITGSLSDADWLHFLANPYTIFKMFAEAIAQQDENNRYILSSSNSGQLLNKINTKVTETIMDYIYTHDVDIADPAKAKYIVAFVMAGTTECFKLWFNHKSTLTLEELCLRISAMVKDALPLVKEL